MIDFVVVHNKTNTTNIFFYIIMVIKKYFDMILTFDLEDYIWILFLVVDYVVVHFKLNLLRLLWNIII